MTLRFYAELNDLLPRHLRWTTITRVFDVPGSVKDLIESCGVPHTEVDLVLVDGRSVDFSYRVADGDRVSVFPVFESFDIGPIVRVRPEPLRVTRFVADTHLGRLARFLRLVGLDTVYGRDLDDHELVRISTTEHRILLTRDVGLLKHRSVTHGHLVRSTDPDEQLVEVVRRFHLTRSLAPFTRCTACNGLLAPGDGDSSDRLPPRTRSWVDEYQECTSCAKLYWRGTHHRRLTEIVDAARNAGTPRTVTSPAR